VGLGFADRPQIDCFNSVVQVPAQDKLVQIVCAGPEFWAAVTLSSYGIKIWTSQKLMLFKIRKSSFLNRRQVAVADRPDMTNPVDAILFSTILKF
jgi:hypothetical protein